MIMERKKYETPFVDVRDMGSDSELMLVISKNDDETMTGEESGAKVMYQDEQNYIKPHSVWDE